MTAERETSVKTVTSDQEQHVSEPVRPDMQEITSSSITISGRTHQLPTTKGYLLKEFKDVFTGVGTLPGGPYHIQLKQDCKAVQHAPRQVAVSLKPEYQAELQRLTGLDVIAEVTEHTEWINSIVPVKKPDGLLRLCLDPKDLNKAIKRNQWYSRTIDDVLPDLAEARFMSLLDARSGFWHVPLDYESSLLTTFNTPWGKYRWLRLPFGHKIAGDVFQERLDRVLRSVPSSNGIADDQSMSSSMGAQKLNMTLQSSTYWKRQGQTNSPSMLRSLCSNQKTVNSLGVISHPRATSSILTKSRPSQR